MTKKIAVIGGGAKAAALAAKAYALNKVAKADIQVTIFEKVKVGAHWDGNHGYTDGMQQLCTPAERDVGFPYTNSFSPAVTELMLSTFSWQTFLQSESKYSSWVNRGALPPAHGDFAKYLEWVLERTGARVKIGDVTNLVPERNGWRVKTLGTSGNSRVYPGQFDAVVATGPGPARQERFDAREPSPTGSTASTSG